MTWLVLTIYYIEGSCGALNLVSDCADGTYNVVPATTYFILVEEFGNLTVTTPNIPSNEDCGSAEVLSGSTGSTNICASAGTNCESGGSVWFEIDVPDDFTELVVTVSGGTISSPAVSIYDACGGTQMDANNCNDSATATCIPMGTYYVEVESESGNEGTFTISESQTVVLNEICDDAIDAGILTCDLTVTGTGVAGACPDPEAIGCLFGSGGIWYEFTTDPSLPTFDITGAGFELFEGSCSSLTQISDCGSPTTITANDATTYYILVDGDFSITTPSTPSNDACGGAISVSDGSSGDNICGTQDDGICGSAGDASVWFLYDLATDVSSLDVSVSGTIVDPAIAFYTACGGTPAIEDCTGAFTTGCLIAGIYYIQVSSEFTNVGDFTFSITETTSPVSNDICDDAEPIALMACEFVSVSGSTVDACPEASDFASGCSINVNETVWFSFSMAPDATSIDLANFSGGLELAIFEAGCPPSVNINGCINSDASMTLAAGADYTIAATNTGGAGDVSFDIQMNVPPSNDPCGTAAELASGEGMTTCCANIEGLDECGGSEAGVWFSYSPADAGVSVSFSNGDMSGNIGIEIYTGDCSGLSLQDSYCGGPTSLDFDFPSCGEDVYIHVTSSAAGCGSFSITASDVMGCDFAEDCTDVSDIMMPSSGSGQTCFSSCTEFSCGGDCAANGVWFQIETDSDASFMEVIVNNANFDPTVSIYQGEDCGALTALVSCASPDVGEAVDAAVNANQTYFVEVGSTSGPGGTFDLCVLTDIAQVECSTGELEPTRPEYPDEDPDGPYCPGEIVNFCYTVNFTVDPIGQGNNCQWIQGIIPTIGGGWDLASLPISDQGPDGGWFWLPEGSVDHNVNSPVLSLINTPHGLGLEYGNGGLSAGDLLPAGWWYTSPGGGSGCANDGDPDTMWGLPEGCGGSSEVEFCFDLQVNLVTDPAQCSDMDFTDLKIHIFTMADGQTGCWSNNSCAGDNPVVFDALMDCTPVIEVIAEDAEICNNGMLNIPVSSSDGSPADIIIEVVEEGNTTGANDWVFYGGNGVIPDVIENEGNDVEIVIYEAYAINPPSVCKGPIKTIEVIVYPDIEVEVEEPYYICYQTETEITPLITGGNGGPYTVEWSNGDEGNTITLPEDIDALPNTYEITMTVTDDLGCSTTQLVEYEVLEPVLPTIIKDADAVCKDGVDDFVQMMVDFVDVGNGPYTFEWDSNPVGLDWFGANDENIVVIDDENSASRSYTVIVIVTDDFGCEYRAETPFVVDNGPELEFEIDECFGSGFDLSGYTSGSESITFELYYDEDGDWNQDYTTLDNEELVLGPVFGTEIDYFAEEFGFYILVGTSQNGCKDFVILEVPPLPLPIFSVMPNDTVCAGTTVTIEVVNQDEYFEFDWSTGASLASITETPLDTITYYLEVELPSGCEVFDSIQIVVNPLPLIEITGSTSICPGNSTTLTALGPATSTYLWQGPGGEMINTQTAMINTIGMWSILIQTDAGCTNSGMVEITENAQLDPQIIGDNFCSGSSVILDGGLGFDSYEWLDDSMMPVGSDPTLEVFAGGVYTLNVVLGACDGTDQFEVMEINPLPPALNDFAASACNTDSGGLPTSIDLTSHETGNVVGTWIDNNGIPVADPTSVEFMGAAVGDLQYTFVTSGATAPCENDTYDFVISIQDCSCPNVDINNPPQFCFGVDTFDLNLITLTPEPGVWSVDPPQVEILNNQFLITNAASIPGNYNLTYTLTNMNIPANCAVDSTVMFSINEPPLAAIMSNADVCNEDTGNGPDFIDLDDLYISGSSGVWSTNEPGLTIDMNNVVSFTGQALGNYTFFYLTDDAVSPCTDVSYTSIIRVIDCSCPQLELMNIDPLCSGGGSHDLNTFLINPEGEPGNWSVTGPDPTALLGNIFDAALAPAGIYTVTFTFNNPPGGSCINSVSTDIEVIDPPMADIPSNMSVCNGTNITVFPTFLDLTSLVTGSGGEWIAPTDYNGGIIDDETNVDFIGVTPGNYIFTYRTNTAIAPCSDFELAINIEVVNCNCPPIIFGTPSPLCNDGLAANLNDLVAPQTGDGVWTFVSGPENIQVSQDSIFNVLGLTAGTYTFEYTLIDTPPAGCLESSQLSIELNEAPDFSLTEFATACNTTSIQGPVCLDFTSFVSGATGDWSAPGNYTGDFTDITNVCFDGLPIGSTYEFSFLTNTAVSPCVDRGLSTTVTIIDCDCPNLNISTPGDICNSNSSIDLSDLEDPNIADGTWSVIAGPQNISLSGTIFDGDGIVAGTYTLQYTPDTTPAMDCDQFSQVDLEVVPLPNAGVANNYSLCFDEEETINLFGLLESEDSGGAWYEVSSTPSSGTGFDSGNGTFTSFGQNAGTYEFEYRFENVAPCPDVQSSVIITIEDLPVADAGQDMTLDCATTEVTIGGILTSSGNGISYQWLDDTGTIIPMASDSRLNVMEAGDYTLVVINDNTGCRVEDNVTVILDPELPSFGTDIEPSPCFGLNAGAIIISSVSGGDGNYLYSIDNGQTWSSETVFQNLAPGTYTVMLQDGNGCEAVESGIVITEPGPLSVDTGEDREIDHGDEFYTLQIAASIDQSQIASIVWTENGEVICSGTAAECASISVDPDGIGNYCAVITDINGCVAEDCVILRERIVRDVYIANTFTPESNDSNRRFYVQSDEFVEAVESFRIFDRWGELVFSAPEGHSPNQPDIGWDGRFKDRPVEQGVYVYVIEVRYDNDETEVFTGDVTILR